MKDLSQFDSCGDRIADAWKFAMKDCPDDHFAHAWDVYAIIFYNGVVSGMQTATHLNVEQAETLKQAIQKVYSNLPH